MTQDPHIVATQFINLFWKQDRANFTKHCITMHGEVWKAEWKNRKAVSQ